METEMTDTDRIRRRYDFLLRRWPEPTDSWVTMAMQRTGDRFQVAGAYPTTPDGLQALSVDAERYRSGADLWLSVCGFGGRPAGKGRERQVSAMSCLWADVDMKVASCSQEELIEKLANLGGGALRPSQLLWSGHGLQPIWLLNQTVDLKAMLGDEADELAALSTLQGQLRVTTTRFWRWLCSELGMKLDNVSNLDRIMRVPETWNLKHGEDGRAEVKILWDEERRWELSSIVGFLDAAGVESGGDAGGNQVSSADAAVAFSKQGTLPDSAATLTAESLLTKYTGYALRGKDWGNGRTGHDWTGFLLAQQLNDHYISGEVALDVLERFQEATTQMPDYRPEDPFPDDWARTKVQTAYGYPPRGPITAGVGGDGVDSDVEDPEEGLSSRDTDHANALLLVERFGEDLKWSTNEQWLVWDGMRWQPDSQQRRKQLVVLLSSEIRERARLETDEDEFKRLNRHANRLEMRGGIEACLSLAEALVAVDVDELDEEADLLTCPNGTLDLRTFRLKKHERKDLATRLCPTEYVPGAWSQEWDDFLSDATQGNQEQMRWLQKWCGYSLTGRTDEDVILVLHGPTRTGKSTFMHVWSQTMGGEICKPVSPDVIDGRARQNAEYVLDSLRGARVATTSELSRGSRMADAFLKMLSGGEQVTARAIYGRPYSVELTCKLAVSTNYIPRSTDPAVHARLRLFPFKHRPKTLDPGLRTRLSESADVQRAVLAWAVEGAKLWREEGLGEPQFLVEELGQFRLDSDPVLAFIGENTVDTEDPAAWVTVNYMWAAYQSWAADNVRRPLKRLQFEAALREHGLEKKRYQNGPMSWMGKALSYGM